MSSEHVLPEEGSVDEQATNDAAAVEQAATPELEPTVELETQAKVDTNHPDSAGSGLTLEQEERVAAREAEIERTHERWDRRPESDREARSRRVVSKGSAERRLEFQRRAGSVDRWADPDEADPRELVSTAELGAVNEQATRLADEVDGRTRAAISRQLAERVADGSSILGAAVGVLESLETADGHVVPIGKLEAIDRKEVSIEGRVEVLWESDSPAIAQVGLIADESGQTKVTIWKKSNAPWIEEGERVRIHGAARNWYEGRVSLAVTGWSTISFPERDRWWE